MTLRENDTGTGPSSRSLTPLANGASGFGMTANTGYGRENREKQIPHTVCKRRERVRDDNQREKQNLLRCHPEPGRPVLANGGEGSAFAVFVAAC